MNACIRERGSALILLLGVIAALATLAVAIVALTANVQSATSKDRSRAKAFNVAEAGLDLGQQQLDKSWPLAGTTVSPLVTSDFLALKITVDGQPQTFLDSSEFPGLIGRVDMYDNPWADGYHAPYSAANPPSFDQTNDGLMYVRSVARVGKKTAGVQAQVSLVPLPSRLPPDILLYTDGPLDLNGLGSGVGSSDEKVPFGVIGEDETATVYADPANTVKHPPTMNFPDNKNVFQAWKPTTVNAQTVFPALDDYVAKAFIAGKEYANEEAFLDAGGWDAANSSDPHLVVIDDGDIQLPNTPGYTIWSQARPGYLIVLNGDVIIPGQQTFYGLIYCKNAFEEKGTPQIFGVVIALESAKLNGDRSLIKDPTVMANLDSVVPSTVRIVPGTWSELRSPAVPAQ